MNYIGAREGVPVPTKPYARAGKATWVVCGCGHKGRPGAFHVCIDLETPEPELPPKKTRTKKPPPDERTRRHEKRAVLEPAPRCKCGKRKDRSSKQCHECRANSYEKPECGTVEGYNWHRRQGAKNPGAHPWPLPKEDACGCRAAQAEASRLRRLQEKSA